MISKDGKMVTIEVYFTHEELVIVALAAHHAEMTLNDFVVEAAVNYIPKHDD